jgi:hypothetical protein
VTRPDSGLTLHQSALACLPSIYHLPLANRIPIIFFLPEGVFLFLVLLCPFRAPLVSGRFL